VVIPSLYATSPRTQSLRPVRVPSDQNTRWRLPFHFPTNKRQYFLVSPHLPDRYHTHFLDFKSGIFAATPRTRDKDTTLNLKWLVRILVEKRGEKIVNPMRHGEMRFLTGKFGHFSTITSKIAYTPSP
jgi:hypothetical protein